LGLLPGVVVIADASFYIIFQHAQARTIHIRRQDVDSQRLVTSLD
jgi:hypothetical protein